MKKYLIIASTCMVAFALNTAFAKAPYGKTLVCQGEVTTSTTSGPPALSPGQPEKPESVTKEINLSAKFKLSKEYDSKYPIAEIRTDLDGTQSLQILASLVPGYEDYVAIRFQGGDVNGRDLTLNFSKYLDTPDGLIAKFAHLRCSVK